MQILPPLPARARRSLGAVPSLFDGFDAEAYRQAYVENFARYALPYLGNSSIPPKGLRDDDLPKGIKYLDLTVVADFINTNRTSSQQALGEALRSQPADDFNKGIADSHRFAAWFLLRLGAYYVPQSPEEGTHNYRVILERKVNPTTVQGYAYQFGDLSKDTLANWVDNPPNWSPWKDWATNPNAILALAVMWAQKVIAQRYGYAIGLFDALSTEQAARDIASRIKSSLINETASACSVGVSAAGAVFGVVSAMLTGPAAALTGTKAAIFGSAGGFGIGQAGRGICSAMTESEKNRIVNDFRRIANPAEQVAFVRGVYAATFGNATPLTDEQLGILFARINEAGIVSAYDLARYVAQPQHSFAYLEAEANARRNLINNLIKPVFASVVGCPLSSGYANVLADKFYSQGWPTTGVDTVEDAEKSPGAAKLKAFLQLPSVKTRGIARGDACDVLKGIVFQTGSGDLVPDPSGIVEATAPSGAYVKLITGIDPSVHETVTNAGHNDSTPPPADLPPAPPAAKSSPLPFIIGAAVVAGLLFARRK